jgi:hypothetical protein
MIGLHLCTSTWRRCFMFPASEYFDTSRRRSWLSPQVIYKATVPFRNLRAFLSFLHLSTPTCKRSSWRAYLKSPRPLLPCSIMHSDGIQHTGNSSSSQPPPTESRSFLTPSTNPSTGEEDLYASIGSISAQPATSGPPSPGGASLPGSPTHPNYTLPFRHTGQRYSTIVVICVLPSPQTSWGTVHQLWMMLSTVHQSQ